MASLGLKHELERGVKYLGALFVSVFFITAGIVFNLQGLLGVLSFAVVITIGAVISKSLGCGLGAKLAGFSTKKSLAIGTWTVPRLEVAMVIAIYGLENGVIGEDIYSMAVFIGLATALVTPNLLHWALKWDQK